MTTQFTTNLDGRILDLVSGRLARTHDAAGVTTVEQFVKLGTDALDAIRGAGVATAREYLFILPDVVEMLGREDGAEEVDAWIAQHEADAKQDGGPFDRAETLAYVQKQGWSDEPAINAGAAKTRGVPEVLREVYYRALVTGADERIASLLAEE